MRIRISVFCISALIALSAGCSTLARPATDETSLPEGTPVPEDMLHQLPDYARDSARIVVHENGTREVVFARPHIPGPVGRLVQRIHANITGDSDNLPLCGPREQLSIEKRLRELFPGLDWSCQGIPDRIMIGPPSGPGPVGP